MTQDFYVEIIEWIKHNMPDKAMLSKHKKDLCKKHKVKEIPTDIAIYLRTNPQDAKIIRPYLQTKPTRTGSGVTVIATMTKPINCPHGSCTYCPGGLNSPFGDTPKSYTGKEPSTMRGMRNDYDPYRIIFNRLEQYVVIGQSPDKVDQIVMGGTFTAFPKNYQEEYIYYSFKAYNDFSNMFFKKIEGLEGTNDSLEFDIIKFKEFFELPGSVDDEGRRERITEKILKLKFENKKTLKEEQRLNEYSAIRCIGLTIETKPDWAFVEQGLKMLELGATRVELGVQTVYDNILKLINRGHGLEDTKKSIADLRDLGFKLNFHMMPGLPDEGHQRITKDKDIESLRTLFDDDSYRPDMLKIYPCMVMPGTALLKQYEIGKFKPIDTKEASEIIVEAYKFIPEYCRIMRIQRDIPTYVTSAGVGHTNLRQFVDELAREKGVKPRDIRAREIGLEQIEGTPEIVVREYTASCGKEYFISMEIKDKLLGFVRLRIPPRSLHPAITATSALIRELHVYGQAVSIGKQDSQKTQHKGVGKKLMAKAEEIALSEGRDKIVVISGVGVRGYYRKLGYVLEGPYMVKELKGTNKLNPTKQIIVHTIVHAPISKVWEYWTKPEHITKWTFASDDWEAPHSTNNLHVDGKFNTRMQAKDGSVGFDFTGTYTTVKEHEVIEYVMDGEDKRHVKITFEKVHDGIKITEIFHPEDQNPIEMQREGWQAILNNFKKYSESLK